MTHVVEHKSFRYSWELVRHTYLVDLGNEIDIQQVEISPSHEGRFLPRPYPRTSYFEVEIDQIQKGGKAVFSFRNICPVEISQKPDWNPFNLMRKSGNIRITQRFQSQEGDTEIRWLYTEDFFLISLSSGDRHDLDMLLSLTLGKLNMIALSVQSGRRIRSEFENQQQYRADMSVMFSKGVDSAFRDVPVYQQHGEMTERDIDVSGALMSAEFQDLNASVAAGWNAVTESADVKDAPPVPAAVNRQQGECAVTENTAAVLQGTESAADDSMMTGTSAVDRSIADSAAGEDTGAGSVRNGSSTAEIVPDEGILLTEVLTRMREDAFIPATASSTPDETIPAEVSAPDESVETNSAEGKTCDSCGAAISDSTKFCGSCGATVGAPISPPESIPAGKTCDSCGAAISNTTKFCGSCGATIGGNSTQPSADRKAASGGIPANGSGSHTPTSPEPEAGQEAAVNLKSIKELEDLSWLND